MKILVCGGRSYNNQERVDRVLDQFINLGMIIHGAATGADTCAQNYADCKLVAYKRYRADWERYGVSAGPIRNKFMLDDNPDISLVVAFPGGRGTENMIDLANKRGILVMRVRDKEWRTYDERYDD